jgi:hypothetical protein
LEGLARRRRARSRSLVEKTKNTGAFSTTLG